MRVRTFLVVNFPTRAARQLFSPPPKTERTTRQAIKKLPNPTNSLELVQAGFPQVYKFQISHILTPPYLTLHS